MTNRYEWVWEGQTQKGSCAWRTRDGELEDGTRWTEAIRQEIIDKTKATYYATVLGEFEKQCADQKLAVALLSCDVQCEIVEDAMISNCYWGSRGEHQFCNYNQPFIVKVKGTVVFESETDLAGIVISTALLVAIGKCLALIILALGVAWGVYEFLRNLTLNETTSTIHTIKYDSEGNVVEDTTENVSKKEPPTESWIAIIIIVIIAFMFMMVVPQFLPKKKR